jgi:hypothetical protein
LPFAEPGFLHLVAIDRLWQEWASSESSDITEADVAQRKTLTEKRIELSRWVADGCPDGLVENDFHPSRRSTSARRSDHGFRSDVDREDRSGWKQGTSSWSTDPIR